MSNPKLVYWLKTYACFISLTVEGFIDNAKGVLCPMIKQSRNLPYSSYSLMQSAMLVGYMVFSLIDAFVVNKFGFLWAFVIGYIGPIIGYIGLYFFNNYVIILICLFIAASGLGGIDLAGNALGSVTFDKWIGLMYCLLSFFYGLGSFFVPPFITFIRGIFNNWTYKELYLISIAPIAISFLTIIFIPYKKESHSSTPKILSNRASISHSLASLARVSIPDENEFKLKKDAKEIVKDVRAWNIALILAFFTITERSAGSWFILYATEYLNLSESEANKYFTIYLIVYTFSRLTNGLITDKVGYFTMLYVLSIAVIICGIFGFSYTTGTTGLYFFIISGYFVSTYWPCCMGIMIDYFKGDSEIATGVVLPVQATIQVIVMSVLGLINDYYGKQYAYMISYVFSIIGLIMTFNLHMLTRIERKNELEKDDM